MKKKITEGIALLADLILPRTCITCGQRLLRHERHLCLGCLMDLPLTYFWQRSHNPMADRFNEVIQKDVEEGSIPHEQYAYAAALFNYSSDGACRLIPYQIKYHDNTEAGIHFGRMLGEKLASSDYLQDVDMIIPVPLHWTREWKRGYNQAAMIAEGVAGMIGVPVRTDLMARRKRTQTQTRLDIEGKARNVAGAFEFRKDRLPENGNTIRHILLIDDVFTTGSTLHACFVALRSVFPPSVRISVATLGFVGGG